MEEYLEFDEWDQNHKDKKISEITNKRFKSLTEVYKMHDDFLGAVSDGPFNDFLLYPDSLECKIVNKLVDQKIDSYQNRKNDVLVKLYKKSTLPYGVRYHLIKKYPLEREWQGFRDHIFNMVFGAAVLDYSEGTVSKNEADFTICALIIYRLGHNVSEVQLFKTNILTSIKEAVAICGVDELCKEFSNVFQASSPLCRNIKFMIMSNFGIENENDLIDDDLYTDEKNNKTAKLALEQYISYFDQIKYSICRHASYNAFFYTQGTIDLNFNFDDDKENRLSQVLKDFERSASYKYRNVNPNSMEYRRKLSCYLNVAFFENKYLISETPPNENKIYFWIAVSSYLDDNQRNYLSQIMNALDDELNLDQKKLRKKILFEKTFQEEIIAEWKSNFGKISTDDDENSIRNCLFKINKQQFSFIMHAPENALNRQQKSFKKDFLTKASEGIDVIQIIRNMIDKTTPKNLSKLKQITDLLTPEKRILIPSCVKVMGNKIESDEPIDNVSVREKDAPEELKNEIANCLFNNEKKYLKPEEYSYEHKCNLRRIAGITSYKFKDYSDDKSDFLKKIANGELDFCFNEEEDRKAMIQAIDYKIQNCGTEKNKNLSTLINGKKLPDDVKKHLAKKYSLEKVDGFFEALAYGSFELDKKNMRTFLIGFCDKYKDNPAGGADFLKKICRNKKTVPEFKNFIGKSIGECYFNSTNSVVEFINSIAAKEEPGLMVDVIIEQYLETIKVPKLDTKNEHLKYRVDE